MFLTADDEWGDAKEALSLNRYAYCQDNPVTYTDPDGHFPIWAAVGAAMGAHDGYRYAKKKRYRGWRKAACIAGGAALGAINPFKCVKAARYAKTAYKAAKKFKRTRGVIKRAHRFVRKVNKYRKYRKVIRKSRQQKRLKCAKKPVRKKFKVHKKSTGLKVSQKQKVQHTAKGCFVAGTLISTDDGEVPIEKIKEGDLVWSKDPETGEVALKAVKKVFVKESNEIIRLTVDGQTIETTPAHVFFTEEYGWIPAGYLEEGVTLLLQSGKKVKIDTIVDICAEEPVRVYNFEVDNSHTYYVSELGVLVHNMCAQKKTGHSSQDNRLTNVNKQSSPIFNSFKKVKGSKLRTSGKGKKKQYYDWDHTHNDIEVYNYRGEHQGSMNPVTGDMYKPPVKGRKITI